MVAAMSALMGCGNYTSRAALDNPEANPDQAESFNRFMFDINEVIDAVILEPVVKVYRYVVPDEARDGVSNFVENLGSPVVFANSVLQGDVDNSFATFWRFAINSTVGLGGLIDVAEDAGLENRKTSFGDTMAVWGVPSGDYVFMPIFGPGTLRDTTGRVVDIFFNPVIYDDTEWLTWAQAGVTLLDARSNAQPTLEEIYRTSLDPYATIRSGYLQRRTVEIEAAKEDSYDFVY